ncbi:MAG: VanW family protein [Bacillota bacterium]
MRTVTVTRRRDKRPVIMLALGLFAAGILAGAFVRHDVVSRNVYAFGVALGGLGKAEASALIKDRAREVESGSLTFEAGGRSVTVPRAEMAVDLDEAELERTLSGAVASKSRLMPSFLLRLGAKEVIEAPAQVVSEDAGEVIARIARELSSEALGTRYGFEGRDLKIFPPASGQVVTEDDVREALKRVSGDRISVPYRELPAPAAAELVELTLTGEFATPYDVSDTDRNVNLALAAEAVHGTVLGPGETYSFNKDAGERTLEKGYRYANVVVGDHLEPGLAGGICQVTTTLFDAAAMAGLDFPEIHAHGIPVDYVSPGTDAAVAWNYLDLKIRNSFDAPVVFGAWVEDGQVVVRVFGKPLDRTYTLEPKVIATYPDPPKEPGLLVETWRVERQNGQEVGRKMLVRSHYLSYMKTKP